jgi:glycine hydroxymethyltransferase
VGAYLLVDMAHFAGLVASGHYPSPFPHAHVATTTTHKTLRGPRGGMILTNDEAMAKKFNSAIFPGIQGGPLMHVIAAKAVAFGEALRPEFKDYQAQVIANAQALADQLMKGGLDIVTGGTDTHLMLVDLRPKGVKGNATEKALGRAHITCNKNGIPFDTEKPMITSGVRLGSPAGTTRGFGEAEFRQIGDWIVEVVEGLAANGEDGNGAPRPRSRAKSLTFVGNFRSIPTSEPNLRAKRRRAIQPGGESAPNPLESALTSLRGRVPKPTLTLRGAPGMTATGGPAHVCDCFERGRSHDCCYACPSGDHSGLPS